MGREPTTIASHVPSRSDVDQGQASLFEQGIDVALLRPAVGGIVLVDQGPIRLRGDQPRNVGGEVVAYEERVAPRVLAVDEPVAFPPPELFERGDRGVGVPLKNRQSNEAR